MTKKTNKPGRFSSVVRAPVAQQVVLAYKKPTISTLSGGDVKIKHREFITDLKAVDGNFGVIQSIPIQPGIGPSFPWLSRIAPNFESYKFDNLTYHITTMASTSTQGTLGMAIDYDASDLQPTSKVQTLAMQDSVRGPVWQPDFVLKANANALNKLKERFVRTTSISGTDIKMYDSGNLFVYTDGVQSSQVIAELHVEYTVTLKTPQLGDLALVANDASLMFNCPSSTEDVKVRDMQNFDNLFDVSIAPVYSQSFIRHAGSLITTLEPFLDGQGRINDYVRFDRPGRYTLDLTAPMIATDPLQTNWGFEFPVGDFGNVRGSLMLRENAIGIPDSGYQAAASIMFEVLRAGAILAMFSHPYVFRNAVRQFSITPVPMSWAPVLTHQLAGNIEGPQGRVYRLWISDERVRQARRSQTVTGKQTPDKKEESVPTPLKVEDSVCSRRIW